MLVNEEHTDYVPILNPDWDPSQEYIPREKRKEWSAVGMMGKLLVRDDGTCQVNGFCKPNNAGIATTAPNGYRVMKRVCENIIQILVK
ncbi:peptidase G2 autoproteolytic cleavage domain-containing protein [Ruminiclostridium herbifermentans]|uniref:peptidase G2 autoproteolytic cleavage domain-containing protein n=1 Tax=Ruminiclostridium herbifermentans TaxID=2488810 RepID=UPI0024579E79|nr:peptidase G2 autoproteolytic cleavage domain-containing protein [Ruminiclostridium herbifermentans]